MKDRKPKTQDIKRIQGFSVSTATLPEYYPVKTHSKPIVYWFSWYAGLHNKNLRMGNVRV